MDQPRAPLRFLDGTFGRGGHTSRLLKAFPRAQVFAFDKDATAVEVAKDLIKTKFHNRLHIIHDDFKNLRNHGLGFFDGALFDLGVSSPQFDEAERGFTFSASGPLDMRMDQKQELKASDIINGWSEKELSDLFYHVGEVRKPNRVVRAIVHDRKEQPFETTDQLAGLIERVDKFKKGKNHPATGYFMALRIAVNGELDGLQEFLEELPLTMEPASRICVISFHSGEDRIVKNAFRNLNKKLGRIVNKKVVVPTKDEVAHNPRARSAKLRVFETGGKV